jgi:hypothetical protein
VSDRPPTAPSAEVRLLLTAHEAAEALAICPRTLSTLTRRGELHPIRLGGRGLSARALRYSVRDLEAWITRQATTPEEIR